MHSCPACPKSFPSPYKLQRHYVIHTGQKPFICTLCGTSFTQSGHLKTHLQKVHHPRLPPDCRQDGIVTHNQQADHQEPFLGINARGSYNCNAMPSTLSSYQLEWKRDTVAHRTEHPPMNVPRESDASAARSSGSNVPHPITRERVDSANEDASTVDAHRGYTCKFSLKSSTSSPRLWNQSPTRNKPSRCERSGASGQSFSKGLRPSQESSSSGCNMTFSHRCPICLKTFSSPSKLQRHTLIHTGQKPYSCGICRKAFRQKVHLKSHLSSANTCSLSARTERETLRFGKSRPASGQQRRGNSSVELELQCKISLNAVQDLVETQIKSEAVVKPEGSFTASSRCLRQMKSDEREQRCVTQKPMQPFQSVMNNGASKSEGPPVRRHEMHQNLNECGTPTTLQNSNNFNVSDIEEIRRLPEPSLADPTAPNLIVKPETCSVNCSDYDDRLPRDWEGVASAERPRETFEATGKQPRTHECRACLKCFPSASKLQRHTMTHTGQRPFGCEMCGKRFRQKTHLRVHCRTHLWSKYRRQRSLYINRPPSCREFTRRTAAEVPVRDVALREDSGTHAGSDVVSLKHLDQTPCAVIIPSYNRESEKLSPHISKQKEVAPPVSTATVKRTPIANSMQNPSAVQHECSRCLKCFPSASKLQRHEMIHTGLKPFLCVLCGNTFRQATHLKSHERTHCEKNPSEEGRRQENVRTPRAESQWQPGISVGIPQRNISVSGGGAASSSGGAEGNVVSAVLCTGPASPITKGNNLLQSQTKFKSHLTCKKRKLYTCRICFQNFAFPYKLSRHLATHAGRRPYKCSACSKSFTQLGHLKVHEHRCRRVDGVSDVQGERRSTDRVQEKCLDDPSGRADATGEQVESQYARVGPSCPDGGSSYLSEEIQPDWLAVSEVGFQEEDNELGKELRDDYQAPCDYDQVADLSSYTFPSELSFEMDKLVQNQNMAAPLFSQYESVAHKVEVPRRPEVVAAVSTSDELLGDEPATPLADNQMRRGNNWCEPLIVFECNMCSAVLQSQNDLERHICSIDAQPKMTESARRNRCDICFKHFVSPSKLKRHDLIHTGLRPFRCDICGKTFTQSGHVRTHRLTH